MRRLAFAAICGTLLLAACSDQQQSPTEPDAPAPEANFGTCRPVRFPIVSVSGLIVQVFPKGRLRTEALVRAVAVALLWDTCHPAAARKVAVNFVNWIDLNAPSTAPAGKVLQLKIAILNGVGIPAGAPAGSPDDFGVGTFDPSNPNKTLIKTKGGTALVELEPGSFDELTTIVVSRKSDGFSLTNFAGNQFPPYFDYDAINASGNHVLNTGHFAIIAFCLLNSDFVTYPPNRRIGHNPVAGAPGFPFEILDPVDLVEGRPDLAAALNCGNLAPTPGPIGFFGNGLPGFAHAAWRTTGRYLGPIARAVFLPEPLEATALITLPPPIGGHAASLSPFGVVEATITTSTSLTSSSSLAIVGAPLTLTAMVSPAPPTTQEASVEFFDGTTSLGTGFLNSDGVAEFTTSSLSLAQHSLTAQFPGTATHGASASGPLVQNMVQRFFSLESFDAALGEASRSTQDFESSTVGTTVTEIIVGELEVSSTFDELKVSLLAGVDKILFGADADAHTRIAGNGRYDLTFVAPLAKNAIAFNVEAKDPATAPATAIVTAGAGSASSSVQNASGSELTPAFVGFIASVPIVTVRFNEGPETGGTGNEETALDDFIVAEVPLP